MSERTLILTPWYSPHKVVGWDKAIVMMFNKKVEVVEEYDEVIYRKGDLVIHMPAVARLVKPITGMKKGVKFSRINVFTRDGFRCQYCGDRKKMRELNYDHVTPRHQGGKTVWENIVSSCYPCNNAKKNRTPAQAGMKLLQVPYRPKTLPLRTFHVDVREIPDIWRGYLGDAADDGYDLTSAANVA